MKYCITIVLLFILSCNSRQENINTDQRIPDSRDTTIKLVDSLGTISIVVPDSYDTFLTWRNISDCGDQCDEIEYRFQPKKLPIYEESGWIYNMPTDSIIN